jgi:hypothetical protein
VLTTIEFNLLSGQNGQKWPKMLKKVKKWKKHCKLAIFSSIFPSNGIFSMDYR